MNKKLAYLGLLLVLATTLLVTGLVKAQDTTAAFTKHSNPHAICNYYRGQGYAIERETDNECLTSIGEGQYKTHTQYYYSGNNWCYKLIQQGKTYHSNCIPIPSSNNSSYAIVFIVVFVLFVVIVASASGAKAKAKKGRGNYSQDSTETTAEQLPQDEPIVGSTADELEKLSQLREKGVISKKEFNLAKKKLLK